MKAMALLSMAGLVGFGLPQVFAQEEISGQPVVYTAPAVVYQAPVVYEGPVVYQGPVIYAAPVIYQTPVYEAPVVYSPIAEGSDLTGFYTTYYVSPNVIIIGEPGNYEPNYYYPNTCNSGVIYFGHRQAAAQGYYFSHGR